MHSISPMKQCIGDWGWALPLSTINFLSASCLSVQASVWTEPKPAVVELKYIPSFIIQGFLALAYYFTKIILIPIWTESEHFARKSRNLLDGPFLKLVFSSNIQVYALLYMIFRRSSVDRTVACRSDGPGFDPGSRHDLFCRESLKNVNNQKWTI